MENWGVIAEHGKEELNGDKTPTGIYIYPYDKENDKEVPNSKKYRIVWPDEHFTEDDKGNIFEYEPGIKHPYVELCDKDDRPEAMGV
jgi:hypothetical protein